MMFCGTKVIGCLAERGDTGLEHNDEARYKHKLEVIIELKSTLTEAPSRAKFKSYQFTSSPYAEPAPENTEADTAAWWRVIVHERRIL